MKLTKLFRLESIQLPRFKAITEGADDMLNLRVLEFRLLPAADDGLAPLDSGVLTITVDVTKDDADLFQVGQEFQIKISLQGSDK